MVSGWESRRRPARPRGPRRPLLALLAALAVTASAAGCVSMPSGGPVLSYTVTQGPGTQSQPYPQIYAQPPGNGWTPVKIVRGFLAASASFANGQQLAREYLTPAASRKWTPGWSATVFSSAPTVNGPGSLATGPRNKAVVKAVVTVTGAEQAKLYGNGRYAVPSAKAQDVRATFELVKEANGQWRISDAPPDLLLTSDLFKYDYQLRNLYFFDPTGHVLVPDPVYVPLQATPVNLMNQLAHDLIKPPQDWLSGATTTAFPLGTTLISDVTLVGGTAAVNLGGAIAKASASVLRQVLPQVSAQLLWTLSSSGQGGSAVQSVELSVNGKPWSPPNSGENPVQNQSQYSQYSPPTGASSVFYYLDGAGNLRSRDVTHGKLVKVAHVGAGYSQIAVSPDGRYLAALHDGSLFIGPVAGKLAQRVGTGYTSMSWDQAGYLWATMSEQVVMLRGAASPQQSLGQPVPVTVVNSDGSLAVGPFTALRVAPDGVRVAIIVGTDLNFGAIVSQPGVRAGQETIKIELSPFSVPGSGSTTFSAVTWYGPDNVITLGGPGQVLTEYPVDGGSSTSIPSPPNIRSITASPATSSGSASGFALVAGVAKDGMQADASLTGSWTPIGTGISPVYPG